ncbi:hypothetical protein G6F64_015280 [Rhizopus arrhizus]|uniref:Uncharacterized protein n=1 Tax=Rhizopus oryzae TaxID=64495 RepID=A0A9P6WRV5_RHIOR|nr:hypothetical protein G6F64_015280 [Rhizopus arrhizus]
MDRQHSGCLCRLLHLRHRGQRLAAGLAWPEADGSGHREGVQGIRGQDVWRLRFHGTLRLPQVHGPGVSPGSHRARGQDGR